MRNMQIMQDIHHMQQHLIMHIPHIVHAANTFTGTFTELFRGSEVKYAKYVNLYACNYCNM